MTTSLPILPPDWDPPRASGCLQTDDYWQWDFGDKNNRPTVFGAPSQTTSCFPPTWAATATYEGTACPTHYSAACPALGEGVVTCCPTAYSFTCAPTGDSTAPASLFKCRTLFTENGDVLKASRTNMRGNDLPESITLSQIKGRHLVAPGLAYTQPAIQSPTTAAPSVASSGSTSSSATSSGGLSTAAKAGVGVGVALGVLVIAAVACWLIWRRKKTAGNPEADPQAQTEHARSPETYSGAKPAEVGTPPPPSALSPLPRSEVSGENLEASRPGLVTPGPHEMQDTSNRRIELPG